MKKILIIVGSILGVAVCCLATFLVADHFHKEEKDQLTATISTYQSKLQAIGTMTTCYTVRTVIAPGTKITQDMLQEQEIPERLTNEDFCQLSDIIGDVITTEEKGETKNSLGYYAKTYIYPGTPITKSLLMSEWLPDSAREMDITSAKWPVGLKEGDYIDIRITYPLGQEAVVLSHKRVMQIHENTMKLYMTEEDMALYNTALVEYWLFMERGVDLYVSKYIEPGVQNPAIPFYSVSAEIATMCKNDPNIIDKARVDVQQHLRDNQVTFQTAIDQDDERGSQLYGGRSTVDGFVNSDYGTVHNEQMENEAQTPDQLDESDSLIEEGALD